MILNCELFAVLDRSHDAYVNISVAVQNVFFKIERDELQMLIQRLKDVINPLSEVSRWIMSLL